MNYGAASKFTTDRLTEEMSFLSLSNELTNVTEAEVINVKNRVYIQVLLTHTLKTAKIGTMDLVVEYIVTTPTCTAIKFTVPIFAVFNVRVYNTCI